MYGHGRTRLKKGDRVRAGDIIAIAGPWKGGKHLHFGILWEQKYHQQVE